MAPFSVSVFPSTLPGALLSVEARRHIIEIQSLRGLAAVLVMISHVSTVYAIPTCSRVWLDAVLNAHASVVLFFVLSGFVLQGSLAKGRPGIRWAADFYIGRVFRIYPAVWVVSSLSILLFIRFHAPVPASSDWFKDYFVVNQITGGNVVLSFLGYRNYLIPPVWTVLVELIGSAFVPFFALLAFQERRLWLLTALLIVPSYFLLGNHLFGAQIFGYVLDFALGAAVWSSQDSLRKVIKQDRLLMMLGLWFGVGLLLFRAAYSLATRGHMVALAEDYKVPIISLVEAFLSTGLVAVIVTRRDCVPWLRLPILVWLGDISFSVYLIHFPLMSSLAWLLYLNFDIGAVPSSGMATLLAILTAAFTLPLAGLCHQFVERPGIFAGRSLWIRLPRLRWKSSLGRIRSAWTLLCSPLVSYEHRLHLSDDAADRKMERLLEK